MTWGMVRLPWRWGVQDPHVGQLRSHAGPRPGSDLLPDYAHCLQSKVSTAHNGRKIPVSDKK